MSEVIRSVHRLASAPLSVLVLAVVACATAEEPDGVGAPYSPQPAAGGMGGSSTASGGSSNLPLSGTTNVGSGNTSNVGSNTGGAGVLPTGGKPSSSGTGTAGVPATGGTSTTPGGTGTTSGCPPYTGTLAKDSLTFMAGFGQASTGMWSGYGYTYKYGTATVTPGMGNSCFAAAKFCANGSVPADDKSGAGLGWNIGQAIGATTTTKVPITTPVKLSFAGASVGMRVQLSASATVSYCYALTAAEVMAGTATIPLASFKTECWGSAGTAYDGVTPIEAIQIAVPGSAAGAAKTFDLCVLDIEPG